MENVFAVSHVGRKPENDPKIKMKMAFSTMTKKTHQFQSIKTNNEVTPKTGETHVPKIQNVGSFCRNNKLSVAFKNRLR